MTNANARLKTSKMFHTYVDEEQFLWKKVVRGPTKTTKHTIVRERDLSYRIYPHFHPYIGELMRRLIEGSTRGLQAADTDYTVDGASLPDSVQIGLSVNATIIAAAGSRIVMLLDTAANSTIGAMTLAEGLSCELAAPLAMTLQAPARVTLVGEQKPTPHTGDQLGADKQAVLFSTTDVRLTGSATVTLFDGTQATIAAGKDVQLDGGSKATVTGTPKVQLVASRRKPVPELFANVFKTEYDPTGLVEMPYPVRDLDFTYSGAYSMYNWELFFHVPLTIAINLSKNGRHAEAQRWFHFLFDPTDDSEGPTPERFWRVRPFQYTDVRKIEEVLINLATGDDPELQNETIRSIDAWKDSPFRPHTIARYRQQAYMYKTVMAYLDNLIAWGDSLFRQDTGEAIDEALMIYVLARNILGPRPQAVPTKGTVRPQTYDNLRKDLKQFGTVMREIEANVPYDLMPFPTQSTGDSPRLAAIRSLGKALYFGVPVNEKLLSYWSTVDDRLFKVHNSLNFQGIFRQLALFEPPIDPGMLARAAAAGLDVGAIVNGLNQPLPLVRFPLLVQKAAEIAQEVKSLGNNLLSAMEKEDNEALAILRAKHERAVLAMAEHVRYGQLQEAMKSREGLVQSLALAVQRYSYYERQLGRKPDEIEQSIPELAELDKESLEKMKFSMQEPQVASRDIEIDIATDAFADAAKVLYGGKIMSSHEVVESIFLEAAQLASDIGSGLNVISSIAAVVPQFAIDVDPFGVGVGTSFGGQNISSAIQAGANVARGLAERSNFEARRAARIDSFARREREWAFQSNLAAGEISQIFKQLRAAEIREAIAEQELKSHRQQMKNAEEIERFLNEEGAEKTGKKTNKALYAWMKREVKGLYSQCFQFAFDIARKAERALQHELGDTSLSYLQFGYLAGKEGLLAGERLFLDVKRMEMAYHDLNQREYELTKSVSLLQIDPMAVMKLRKTGRCTVSIPEAVFDMDGPGHYFRRIKSVALSIPCVTGPYTGVNCTLTLLKSSIRKTQILNGDIYERENAEDARFDDYFGSLQSIVTSSGVNDSGLFETNLRDERYLPFENSGVVSEWQLQLPADPSKDEASQFDYDTISDAILHIRYTAREGGGLLRGGALNWLNKLSGAQAIGAVRFFSMRHDFPSQWSQFLNQKPTSAKRAKLTFTPSSEHYPFWIQGKLATLIVDRVDLVALRSNGAAGLLDAYGSETPPQPGGTDLKTSLGKDASLGGLLAGALGGDGGLPVPLKPTDKIELFFDDIKLDDLWIAVKWRS